MSLRQLFIACEIATIRQASSQGGLDKFGDALQPHRMINCALRGRSATARELQDLGRVTGVTESDQIVRNRIREVSLETRRPVRVLRLTQQHRTGLEFGSPALRAGALTN